MSQVTNSIRKFQRRCQDGIVRLNAHWGLGERAENFVQLFESYLPCESQVLDIGGGWGFYADPLARRGHQVTVLDVVKPGFQKAPVVLYEGRSIPFADRSFDASLLIGALHHCPDPEAVVREARRVTRRILVVVEDLYHHSLGRWWTVVRDQLYNFEFFGHPRQFKKGEEWVNLFERLGFALLEEKQIYTWLAGMRILNGLFVLKVS